MSAPYIFISYAHDDTAIARLYAEALKREGFDVWWDNELRSGEVFDEAVESALRSARVAIVLWSPSSVASRWVRAEATLADRNKTLVPVTIAACQRPIIFELTQTAELPHWRGDRSDPAWKAFVGELRKRIASEPAPAQAEAAPATLVGGPAATSNRRRLLLAAAALLAIGGATWAGVHFAAAGSIAGSKSTQRIPVLIRAFAASGSGDQKEGALAGGITDELINRLRRVSQLQIGTAGNGGSAPSDAFASAYIVEGDIRSSGDELRVTARLFKPNREILWSDTYDGKLADVFDVQERIAKAVADALSVSLDVGANSVAYGGTSNPEAYAAFLQFKTDQYSFDQSVPLGYLDRALALDPNYLKALSALSDSYGPRIAYAKTSQEAGTLLTQMDASTSHMLATNPKLWMGHVSRAWYYISREDFAGANQQMELAQKLDTQTDPELPAELATLEYCLGYTDKASALMRSAQIIDPLFRSDPRMIRDLLYTGKYQQAIDLYAKLAQDGNRGRLNHTLEAFWAYMLSGREADAMTIASGNQPGGEFVKIALAFKANGALPTMTQAELHNWADAEYLAGGQFRLADDALLASFYGHPDLAVELMRLAVERPGPVGPLSLFQPAFANARKTAAFAKLATELGLVKVWRESGDWGDYCGPVSGGGVTCH